MAVYDRKANQVDAIQFNGTKHNLDKLIEFAGERLVHTTKFSAIRLSLVVPSVTHKFNLAKVNRSVELQVGDFLVKEGSTFYVLDPFTFYQLHQK